MNNIAGVLQNLQLLYTLTNQGDVENETAQGDVGGGTETPRSSTGGLSTISNQDSTSELIAAYETAFDEMTAGAIQSLENGINDMHAKNSETAAKAALKLGKGFTF